MTEKLFIGLDFGSDSVRALLVSANGRELKSAVHHYTRWSQGKYSDAGKNQFRQHPLDYLEGMETVIREVMQGIDPRTIAGIGVDTTASTPCAVDSAGLPLALRAEFSEDPDAMFILWKDHTALAEADRINTIARSEKQDYTLYEGGTYSPEWYWSKVLHVLRNNPAVREHAASFVEHCDWIPAVLTGNPVKPGRCSAGHKMLWHESWGGFPPESFFETVDPLLLPIRRSLDSETVTADIPVGTLSPEWAERLGLTTGTVIAGGMIDCHSGAVGAGIRKNQIVKVIGTSTCDLAVADNVDRCIRGICGQVNGSIVPGLTGLEAGQSAFGDIFAWFKRFLNTYGDNVDLAQLEQDAAQVQDGEVMALDWHNGRRNPDADPLLAGAVFGLRLGTTPAEFYRALVESVSFGSRRIADRFREYGIPMESVIATGGIARKSPFVMQMLADALEMPIRICSSDQTCALGAAICAATAAGTYPDIPTAMTAMSAGCDQTYTPGRDLSSRYKQYCRYARWIEDEMQSR